MNFQDLPVGAGRGNRDNSQVAIVTGAASGIGLTVAKRLAADGVRIAGVDRDQKVAERMAELPGEHIGVVADLTDPNSAASAVRETVESLGGPTILVNSAGVALIDPALEVSPERWKVTLDVNLSGSFYMAQAAGAKMVERGYGRIINLASQAAVVALPGHAAYAATKAGILGLTRVLAREWAEHGVTVNAVSPTIVETPLGKEVWSREKGEAARAEIPVGRFAQPEEIADLIVFLAGEKSAMITGENIMIDGGRSII